MSPSNVSPRQKKTAVSAILWIGLVAGTLDAVAATISYLISTGGNPIRIFQYIASAVIGKSAFSGGLPIAFLGLVLHFIIAYAFTIFFFLIYPKVSLLSRNIVVTGIVYGLIIWLVMNRIVLPMVNLGGGPFNITQAIKGIVIIIVAVGLPITVLTNKYYENKSDI